MVTIQEIHFAYKSKMVFDGLSVDLEPGHIYGLFGRNGSGKSTLLRNIAGLLFPRKGIIRALNFEPALRQPSFLQKVFIIPEEFDLPDISIRKLVECLSSFYPKFSIDQFNRYNHEFEIQDNDLLENMSYGQKKKVLIGLGLASNTPILLMDEPTNGLDIIGKSQFRKVIAGVLDEEKCIIISTHQVRDLENLIDRILVLDQGKILFDRAVETVSRNLSFKSSFDPEEIRLAVYAEPSLRGYALITSNKMGDESKLDLETLYKAILSSPEKINSVFNS